MVDGGFPVTVQVCDAPSVSGTSSVLSKAPPLTVVPGEADRPPVRVMPLPESEYTWPPSAFCASLIESVPTDSPVRSLTPWPQAELGAAGGFTAQALAGIAGKVRVPIVEPLAGAVPPLQFAATTSWAGSTARSLTM